MPTCIIRNQAGIDDLAARLAVIGSPLTVTYSSGVDRSKQQNALQWMWAGEVARQLGDRDAADMQAEWKLKIGVPIMREDDAFRAEYDAIVKPLDYERKVWLMKMGFSVTSLMKIGQMVRYLNLVEQWCARNGLHITPPDPELRSYMERKAA